MNEYSAHVLIELPNKWLLCEWIWIRRTPWRRWWLRYNVILLTHSVRDLLETRKKTQNWVPPILSQNLWLIFMGIKQKKFFFAKKKSKMADFSKSPFFKIANSQNFFVKISWIGPWVSRIDWCEGHWCSSTYMVVRLSNIRAKTA